MSDIRKRMAHVRAVTVVGVRPDPKWVHRNKVEMFKRVGMDPPRPLAGGICITGDHYDALKCAREYFGIDKKKYGPSADEYLALAMALVLFGKHQKGRAKGTKTWTEEKLLDLAGAFWLIKEKDATLSDAEICRRLGRGGDPKSEFKNYDPEHLRTLLPTVKRAVRDWHEDNLSNDDL
jgi:hypothetical protein